MAYADKNGKSKPIKKQSSKPAFRFINYNLDTAEKDDLRKMDIHVEFGNEALEKLVSEGYKFSLTYDSKNNSFIVSMIDTMDTSPYWNCCISGRGSSLANARASVLYRHVIVAEGDWSSLDKEGNSVTPDFG